MPKKKDSANWLVDLPTEISMPSEAPRASITPPTEEPRFETEQERFDVADRRRQKQRKAQRPMQRQRQRQRRKQSQSQRQRRGRRKADRQTDSQT